jgi:hypothetical protein
MEDNRERKLRAIERWRPRRGRKRKQLRTAETRKSEMTLDKTQTSFRTPDINVNQRKWIQSYHAGGWFITPVEFGGTKPVFDDWKTRCFDMRDIDRLFFDEPMTNVIRVRCNRLQLNLEKR